MDSTVYTKIYEAPPIDKKEILRYAGVRGDAPELEDILASCIAETSGRLTYKVCYRELPISVSDEVLDLGFCRTASSGLKKNLNGCSSIILFAATVGIEIDRLIARYSAISPTKALMLQAIGAERIESLCNLFNIEISEQKKAEGYSTRPRFSAGYGDFSIEAQKEIFAALDCSRKIGLSLNQSLLMSPSKSVTAIIGISKDGRTCDVAEKCEACDKRNCEYRRA